MEQEIAAGLMEDEINTLVEQSMMTGMPVDMNMIQQQVQGNADVMKEAIQQSIRAKAKENAKKVRLKLDDQLTEGGWYRALDRMVDDVIDQKAGFLKGPIFRKQKKRKLVPKLDGGFTVSYEDVVSPMFERRSPFYIYPAPDAIDVDDGYLFDRLSLTRRRQRLPKRSSPKERRTAQRRSREPRS
jgi:hypothetical protein